MGKYQQEVISHSEADQLRLLIDTCEETQGAKTADEARSFMSTLHQAHRLRQALEDQSTDLDLRAESARLAAVDERLLREARKMIRLLGGDQAFIEYRQQFDARPEDRWWQLDARVAAEQRRTIQRIAIAAGIVAVLAVVVYLARGILFPPNPVGDAVNSAGTRLDARNLPGALAEIDTGLNQVPTSTELLVWKGMLLELSGDAAGAQQYFDQARDNAASAAEYYLLRGQAYLRLGAADKVIANSDELLKLEPKSAEAYYLRATGYEMKGERILAMQDLDRSAQLAQDAGNDALYAMARYRYAILMQSQDMPEPTPTPTPPA